MYNSYDTERLFMRPTNEGDAALVLALLNTPKWLKYVGDRHVSTEDEAKEYIRKRMLPQLESHGYSNYTMIRKEDNAKVGCCGLYDREGLEGVDIGYSLLPEFEGNGYALEGARELIRAAKEDFAIATVKGITSKDHFASQNLLKKLGMVCTDKVILPDEEEELLVFELDL